MKMEKDGGGWRLTAIYHIKLLEGTIEAGMGKLNQFFQIYDFKNI